MKNTITDLSGNTREVDCEELNGVTKDILLFFHWHLGESLGNAFVPRETFDKDYWEYLSVEGGTWFNDGSAPLLYEGCLILIAAMAHEYLELESGNQQVFLSTPVPQIQAQVRAFCPTSPRQERLQKIADLALRVVSEARRNDRNDAFAHPELEELRRQGQWIREVCIPEFYRWELDCLTAGPNLPRPWTA